MRVRETHLFLVVNNAHSLEKTVDFDFWLGRLSLTVALFFYLNFELSWGAEMPNLKKIMPNLQIC